jgi:multidrug resistance efflux pump
MRRGVLVIVLLLLAVGGYLGYTQVYAPSVMPTPTPELVDDFETVIWASGEVVPATWASLSFPIGGQVVELAVSEGTTVSAGTVLARLDAAELEDAVTTAEAAVAVARADMTRLKAAARPPEIAQAEASIQSAEAVKDAAQAHLEQAQAELAMLLAGARPEDVEAEAAAVLKAESVLRQAQTEYDKVAWAGEVGETPQALALEAATLDYTVAQASYEALVQGARPEEVQAAQAAVAAARAGLAKAEAEVDVAQSALDLLRDGATLAEIAVAEAGVVAAEANLAAAETGLGRAVLVAPFDGTVGDVSVRLGEQVLTALPRAVVILGDLETLQVETTDLRETDVARIDVGQPVDITFDAFPDVLLKGRIASISPKSSSEKGGVNYTTVIKFVEFDDRLRWGMTAYVNITVK